MLHCTTNAFNVAKKDIGLETVRTVATTRGIREENDQAPIPGTKHFFILIYNYIYLFQLREASHLNPAEEIGDTDGMKAAAVREEDTMQETGTAIISRDQEADLKVPRARKQIREKEIIYYYSIQLKK